MLIGFRAWSHLVQLMSVWKCYDKSAACGEDPGFSQKGQCIRYTPSGSPLCFAHAEVGGSWTVTFQSAVDLNRTRNVSNYSAERSSKATQDNCRIPTRWPPGIPQAQLDSFPDVSVSYESAFIDLQLLFRKWQACFLLNEMIIGRNFAVYQAHEGKDESSTIVNRKMLRIMPFVNESNWFHTRIMLWPKLENRAKMQRHGNRS